MKNIKGIILSGGTGSRFFPVTRSISKQLLAIYNKPMIYYSLSILMMMGIKNILIIVRPDEKKLYQKLLLSGEQFGIRISYKIQKRPGGIAQSFIIGKKFIKKSMVALILGDNFFYSPNLKNILEKAIKNNNNGASIFICKSKKPKEFGVVEFSKNKIKKISEKPKFPKSKYVVTGLYLYDNRVVKLSSILKPSKRKELEITDLNNLYLKKGQLKAIKMQKSTKWMDNGSCDSLLETSNYVKKIENKKRKIIFSPEAIAFERKWINKNQLKKQIKYLGNTGYANFLTKLYYKK